MAKMSNYLEDEILDHILMGAGESWAAPTTIYMALTDATMTDASTGSTLSEISDTATNYSRQSVAFGTNASGGTISNTGAATQFICSGTNFGTVQACALVNIGTRVTGEILFYDNDLTDTPVNDGDTLQFAVGDIDVSID